MDSTSADLFANRIVVILAAMLVNALFLGPPRLIQLLGLDRPGRAVTALLRMVERKLNREKRASAELVFRGRVVAYALLVASLIAGMLLFAALRLSFWGPLVEIILMAFMLSPRQDFDYLRETEKALKENRLDAARDLAARHGHRNAAILDAHSLARAPIETAAVHLADRLVSPILWYALLGLPGLLACRSLTLLSDITSRSRAHFGQAADQLHSAIAFVPSHLSVLLTWVAAYLHPSANPDRAYRAWRDSFKWFDYRMRQMDVIGSCFNLSLGGPVSLYTEGGWTGGDIARAEPLQLRWMKMYVGLMGLIVFLLVASFLL